MLLAVGVVAGPLLGWLQPDQLLGPLLMPSVSLSVAVILYEGALNLKLRDLRRIGLTFASLATVGVAVSWALGSLGARFILGLRWPVALMIGAILVVTGPTVIGPLLRHLRLRGRVGSLLKWEGIVVDPIGAVLAVSVFAFAHAVTLHEGAGAIVVHIGQTLLAGVTIGILAAAVLSSLIARFWMPDQLHNPVSLTLMLVAFASANMLQEESGLIAVTVMGIAVANQPWFSVRHVVEFKESLTVLLISVLFIILSARLTWGDLQGLNWKCFLFLIFIIVVARPASVIAATWWSSITWRERWFLCFMAPRGIVAAAVSSALALKLAANGFPRAVEIIPVTLLVVFATVSFYGLLAKPLAFRLNLIQPNPQGILFVGADLWVRELAKSLQDAGCPVFLVDTDRDNIQYCRDSDLRAIEGSALAITTRDEIDFTGLGRLLAVTSNNEVNSLASISLAEEFGKQECYQLPYDSIKGIKHDPISKEHLGRILFGERWTFSALQKASGELPVAKRIKLTNDFDFNAYRTRLGDTVLPLFVVKQDGSVQVKLANSKLPDPKPGDSVIALDVSHRSLV
jgi:NhaP-type Na+/H+ or K+/H+ antiporter